MSVIESVGRYSAAIHRLSQSLFNHKLAELEIGSGQHDFFLVIARHEGITQKELGDRLYVEKSTTAKAVKHLVAKGYIYKKQIEGDRRYSSLYLTEQGRKARVSVEGVFTEMLSIYARNIPEDRVDHTIEILKQVIGNLQEEKRQYAGEVGESAEEVRESE